MRPWEILRPSRDDVAKPSAPSLFSWPALPFSTSATRMLSRKRARRQSLRHNPIAHLHRLTTLSKTWRERPAPPASRIGSTKRSISIKKPWRFARTGLRVGGTSELCMPPRTKTSRQLRPFRKSSTRSLISVRAGLPWASPSMKLQIFPIRTRLCSARKSSDFSRRPNWKKRPITISPCSSIRMAVLRMHGNCWRPTSPKVKILLAQRPPWPSRCCESPSYPNKLVRPKTPFSIWRAKQR